MQYNILLLIRQCVQDCITSNPDSLLEHGVLNVVLSAKDFPYYYGRPEEFRKELVSMMKNLYIEGSWRYKPEFARLMNSYFGLGPNRKKAVFEEGELVKFDFPLLIGVRYGTTNGSMVVTINPTAVPVLLYVGKGVGGTRFNLQLARSFKSVYSKRVFELISDWVTVRKGDRVCVPIREFLLYFKLPENYENKFIKRNILDVAKREIDASSSSVKFDYSLEYDPVNGAGGTGRRKTANTVVFTIFSPDSKRKNRLTEQTLLVMLQEIADREKLSLCPDLAASLMKSGSGEKVAEKFSYYGRKLKNGAISKDEFRNTMLKIVREISDVDLRSQGHIRNSALQAQKVAGRAGRGGRRSSAAPAAKEPTLFGEFIS